MSTIIQKQVMSRVNAGSPGDGALMVYFVFHGIYCTITNRKGNQKWKRRDGKKGKWKGKAGVEQGDKCVGEQCGVERSRVGDARHKP